MGIFLDLVLAALAAGFVVIPLLRETTGEASEDAGGEDREAMLEERKHTLLEELKEMELDQRSGKLSEVDYAELAGRYKRSAAQVLAELDRLRSEDEAGDREDAAEGARGWPAASPGGGAKRKRARGRRGGGGEGQRRFCSSCGAKVAASAKFCGSCGRGLAPVAAEPRG